MIGLCVATVIASFSSSVLTFDAWLMEWLREHRNGQHTDTALIVTAVGSTPVALGLLLVGTLLFLVKRWWFELWFLLLSVVGGTQLNPQLKALFDRPRPFFPDQALTFNGSGFPSGHAMTATVLYGALAVIVLRHRVSPAQRVATVVAAATLVAIVAATRVYLGAHYFTDVVGGIAFGLLWLTICEFVVGWAVPATPRDD